jgi:hypothetical protein
LAKELSEKYSDKPSFKKSEPVKVETKPEDYDKILADAFIDLDIPVERPPICMYIRDAETTRTIDKRLFTLGNFSAITGKGKSKKTFLCSMLMAAACKRSSLENKFIPEFPEGKDVCLYFDTEQGIYDAYTVGKRIEALAGTKAEYFKMFALREFSPSERVDIIEHGLKKFSKNLGYIIIDGIADLTTAINDEEKASEAVGHLMRWSKNYNCHITVVIHQNKNDEYATGHLGSSIIKKAEVVIKVAKSESYSISNVSCDMIRGASDFDDFAFEINEDGIPHITTVQADAF